MFLLALVALQKPTHGAVRQAGILGGAVHARPRAFRLVTPASQLPTDTDLSDRVIGWSAFRRCAKMHFWLK